VVTVKLLLSLNDFGELCGLSLFVLAVVSLALLSFLK
jgi:hypothetical protein